jgi:hypothetical protein
VISAAKNLNQFQKSRFWKEKWAEDVITLESLSFNSTMISSIFGCLKSRLQNNVHMLSFPTL